MSACAGRNVLLLVNLCCLGYSVGLSMIFPGAVVNFAFSGSIGAVFRRQCREKLIQNVRICFTIEVKKIYMYIKPSVNFCVEGPFRNSPITWSIVRREKKLFHIPRLTWQIGITKMHEASF